MPTANTDKSAGLWPRREITAAGSSVLNEVLHGLSEIQRVRLKKPLIIAGCLCGCAITLTILWRATRPPPIAWQVNIPGLNPEQISVGRDGTVYLTASHGLLVFGGDGNQRWATPKGLSIDSKPAIGKDGTIYAEASRPTFGSLTNRTLKGLVALQPQGSVKWWVSVDEISTGLEKALILDNDDTIYFSSKQHSDRSTTVFAVGADGRERWHFTSNRFRKFTFPMLIAADDSILFQSVGETNDFVRFDATGKRLGEMNAYEGWPASTDWDGTLYIPARAGAPLMTSLNADGSVRWRLNSPFMSIAAPTIGADGTLYFPGLERPKPNQSHHGYLFALEKNGKPKWRFPMGHHLDFRPPTVASDGTLFFQTGPRMTALTPNGKVKWVFEPPRRFKHPQRIPRSWKAIKSLWKEYFAGPEFDLDTSSTLTPEGMLYVTLGDPYYSLYAMRVGVGLATNSPWPMPGGDARLTGRVAARP